jgi:hypothetical protein
MVGGTEKGREARREESPLWIEARAKGPEAVQAGAIGGLKLLERPGKPLAPVGPAPVGLKNGLYQIKQGREGSTGILMHRDGGHALSPGGR